MGYELYREVKDHAPSDLTQSELLLFMLIADDANEGTRISYATRNQLVTWMRMSSWDSVRKILNQLRKKGIELREPVGKDDAGNPIYSYQGRRETNDVYRIPVLDSAANNITSDSHPKSGRSPRTAIRSQVDHLGQPSDHLGQPSEVISPAPSSFLSSGSPHLSLVTSRLDDQIREAGVEDGERDDFSEWIRASAPPDKPIKSVRAYLRKIIDNGDLIGLIAEWRAPLTSKTHVSAPGPWPWCGHCGDPLAIGPDGRPIAETNPKFRTDTGEVTGVPCTCNPAHPSNRQEATPA